MNARPLAITLIVFAVAAHGVSGCARNPERSDSDLRGEVAVIKQEQDNLRKELVEIRQLLQQGQRAAAPRSTDVTGQVFDVAGRHGKGNSSASVVLLEFTDYQCPFCKRHTLQTQPEIEREYVDTGKVRFVSFDMPIASLHPLAFKAAEAARCAGDEGKFWQMRDRLFDNQKAFEPWSAHAEALGLDVARFEACLDSGKHADAVRRDMAEAEKAGASGTPSFVVARVNGQDPGKVRGLKFIRGAQPYAAFKQALDEALR